MQVQPYLFFNGRCQEAIDFYRSAVGAEVLMLSRFKESPDPSMIAPGTDEKIMHASLRIGESEIMLSDGRCSGQTSFAGFSMSIMASNDAEAERLFDALSVGGKVEQPLIKTFFASSFGMLEDRFGVGWMVIVMSQ